MPFVRIIYFITGYHSWFLFFPSLFDQMKCIQSSSFHLLAFSFRNCNLFCHFKQARRYFTCFFSIGVCFMKTSLFCPPISPRHCSPLSHYLAQIFASAFRANFIDFSHTQMYAASCCHLFFNPLFVVPIRKRAATGCFYPYRRKLWVSVLSCGRPVLCLLCI